MSERFLIVGLGNPGAKYAETRHNAGFWFLGRLLAQQSCQLKSQSRQLAETAAVTLAGANVILARPTTFMNHSGQAVRALMDFYRIDIGRLFIAYDELDLDEGVSRLKQGGGHGGHNGLRDICQHLGQRDFMRLRIGIGHPGHRDAVVRYVLSRAPADARRLIDQSIEEAVDIMPMVLEGRLQEAMTTLHTRA